MQMYSYICMYIMYSFIWVIAIIYIYINDMNTIYHL